MIVHVINRFIKPREYIPVIGHLVAIIKSKVTDLNECTFMWCVRNCNKATYSLSKLALANHCNISFMMDYPREIHNDVIVDSIE